jgi:hypothetical protein
MIPVIELGMLCIMCFSVCEMWLAIMISICLGPTFSNLRMTHSTISGTSSVYHNWHMLSCTVDRGSCICLPTFN